MKKDYEEFDAPTARIISASGALVGAITGALIVSPELADTAEGITQAQYFETAGLASVGAIVGAVVLPRVVKFMINHTG